MLSTVNKNQRVLCLDVEQLILVWIPFFATVCNQSAYVPVIKFICNADVTKYSKFIKSLFFYLKIVTLDVSFQKRKVEGSRF